MLAVSKLLPSLLIKQAFIAASAAAIAAVPPEIIAVIAATTPACFKQSSTASLILTGVDVVTRSTQVTYNQRY